MQAHVDIQNVHKRFGETIALNNVSLQVAQGEVVSIIGPSGSGKSTLIRCVHMLESYDAGSIHLNQVQLGYKFDGDTLRSLNSAQLAEQRSHIGMVFQQFNLFPHRSVIQNIADAPMRLRGVSKDDAYAEAHRLLELVKLSDKAERYPRQLSGGQQQRVAIARTMAMKPDLLLFDEPTSALDPETVGEVLQVIKDVTKLGTTTIVVTHEIDFARDVADRIVFMENGAIIEQGTPTELLDNPSPRLEAFLR